MANTAQEDLLAISAFKEISRKYAASFSMNPSVTGFSQAMLMGKNIGIYVKFMDNASFMNNYSMGGSQKQGSKCAICGFTSPKTGNKYDREMFVNRQYANSSTVVHEMLHFLTHPQFWMYVPSNITEAVTEYFTRKVVSSTADANFDISQRAGRYDTHHSFLSMGRGDIKSRTAKGLVNPGKGYMKRAYFQGDQAAIAFILNEFSSLEEILAADTEDK
ncbi:MAG TPA: hypothetical protein VGG85_16855 [Terracidiphilus sp.]